MFVGIATYDLHIPHAQSLKEKRMVVRSLRDRLRHRFAISVAEVAHQELHQRARLAVAVVSADAVSVERVMQSVGDLVASNGDSLLTGSHQETIAIDDDAESGTSGFGWEEEES
jgi:uncharacterized protein